jgi:hypothetical protein
MYGYPTYRDLSRGFDIYCAEFAASNESRLMGRKNTGTRLALWIVGIFVLLALVVSVALLLLGLDVHFHWK